MIAAVAEATWFGLAAAISSLFGVGLAIVSHRQARKTAAEETAAKTHDLLLISRREAEQLSEELHKCRMEQARAEESR